ncbi:TPA: DUF547 domain-containing protein [Legionella pneumophila]|nr:DUF547 domain-containing protein [Legionella pneumophila]HAT1987739.1 DUF547 domain-containing protein [Legionella pneumophila]HAT7910042.1 DUF547 domain-containing protein [Legionella pneumophila]HAT7913539.1 DUF547 domain-containing protein [Legionella pneumophila]HAT7916620.1 DUF547 domain-containing protein [Legionella pneumophila]HAT7983342.1 DUF547 domain-containing protein [Legionella pneumophila]
MTGLKVLSLFAIAVLVGAGLIIYHHLTTPPTKNLSPHWQAHQADSTRVINHQTYQDFLTHYLYQGPEGINFLHYSRVNQEDKAKLAHYIKDLSHIPISQYNRTEQLAYWINLYNALTIQLILTHWPVQSILKLRLSPGFLSIGPWDATLITIEDQEITLNDIEHRILRPIWQDARIHYTLNCASMSCPQLQSQAFTGKNVDSLMNKAAKEYVNSPQGVTFTDKELILSQIYQWYQTDFGDDEQAVLRHIAQYANPKLKQQLMTKQKPIRYHYNWQINGN